MVKKVKRTKTLPFGRLLEGVVAVLSGFQNPLRGQLRDRLLAMGAKYKPEWNGQCTHLVSAFANTPKFREVKGRGKIVTKDWVEQCHAQRKRLPWRRYLPLSAKLFIFFFLQPTLVQKCPLSLVRRVLSVDLT